MNTSVDLASKNEATADKVGMIEKLIIVNRTAKVVEGGKLFGFTACVVVGDRNRKVIGIGIGKARDVTEAIKKAVENGRKNLVKIELNGNTLQHKIVARYGASKVFMQPASEGTGVIAGGPMRAVFEVLGVQNVLAKAIGSSTPLNVVRATLKGLLSMNSPRYVAAKRGKKIREILPQTNKQH